MNSGFLLIFVGEPFEGGHEFVFLPIQRVSEIRSHNIILVGVQGWTCMKSRNGICLLRLYDSSTSSKYVFIHASHKGKASPRLIVNCAGSCASEGWLGTHIHTHITQEDRKCTHKKGSLGKQLWSSESLPLVQDQSPPSYLIYSGLTLVVL